MLKPIPTDLKRNRLTISINKNNHIIVNDKPCLHFCSNDYLGIARDIKMKEILVKESQSGLGSSSSPLIAGFYAIHQEVETAFADFLERDRALLFNSGFHANIGVITALANRQTIILSDKNCHASLLDGIQLSRAKHYRYSNDDMVHAKSLLNKITDRGLLVTESVFSMSGHIASIATLSNLAIKAGIPMLVDDAHGIGVLGNKGKGICEYYSLSQQQLPYLIIPLGKALGSMGAIVAGPEDAIEHLLQTAKTYRYSTALPPMIARGTLLALRLMQKEDWRRHQLQANIIFFKDAALKRGFTIFSTHCTPIQCILMPSNVGALQIQTQLLNKGFYVACIRPPTVAKGKTCLRISLNCYHTETEMLLLLDQLAYLLQDTTYA